MNDRIRRLPAGLHEFVCPGCDEPHTIDPAIWTFNGNYERPTLSPSVLVRGSRFIGGPDSDPTDKALWPKFVCHSFVRNGRIQFLGDCTHALAGQTVDLPTVNQVLPLED